MGIEKRKKVSCHVITYNHKDYISQCLDGILMQQTDFDFEIIIGDDVSTDGTREIVQEYAAKYPGLIKLNLREKRGEGIPGKENFVSTLEMCHGEYISLCDGDDYWTEPLKLQKQIDFLDANKDYSICFHGVDEIDLGNNILTNRLVRHEDEEKTYTIEDLAVWNFIHVVSTVFRNNFNKLPTWFKDLPAGDYPLHILNAKNGKIKYFPEKMAAYRVGVGVWSSQSLTKQCVNTIFVIKTILAHNKFSESTKKKFEEQINKLIVAANKDNISTDTISDPEKAAYNLPLKKLLLIMAKKIKYSF